MEIRLNKPHISSYAMNPAEADDLAGKSVLVTGGASGLGAALCHVLSACGAQVAIGDINLDKAKAVASLLDAPDGKTHAIGFDVGNPSAAERAVDETIDRFGKLDV